MTEELGVSREPCYRNRFLFVGLSPPIGAEVALALSGSMDARSVGL